MPLYKISGYVRRGKIGMIDRDDIDTRLWDHYLSICSDKYDMSIEKISINESSDNIRLLDGEKG